MQGWSLEEGHEDGFGGIVQVVVRKGQVFQLRVLDQIREGRTTLGGELIRLEREAANVLRLYQVLKRRNTGVCQLVAS